MQQTFLSLPSFILIPGHSLLFPVVHYFSQSLAIAPVVVKGVCSDWHSCPGPELLASDRSAPLFFLRSCSYLFHRSRHHYFLISTPPSSVGYFSTSWWMRSPRTETRGTIHTYFMKCSHTLGSPLLWDVFLHFWEVLAWGQTRGTPRWLRHQEKREK